MLVQDKVLKASQCILLSIDVISIRPTRQDTLFPINGPGILEEGRSVGAQEVAMPVKARFTS